MEVKIKKGVAWYENEVGNIFKVDERKAWFRSLGGGARVPHYVVIDEPPVVEGGMTRQQLIDCMHAEEVK